MPLLDGKDWVSCRCDGISRSRRTARLLLSGTRPQGTRIFLDSTAFQDQADLKVLFGTTLRADPPQGFKQCLQRQCLAYCEYTHHDKKKSYSRGGSKQGLFYGFWLIWRGKSLRGHPGNGNFECRNGHVEIHSLTMKSSHRIASQPIASPTRDWYACV